jgi:hypothetical protein
MKSLLVAAAAVALSCPGGTFAQTYPAKPVRYIVPFPVGGSPDIVGRLLPVASIAEFIVYSRANPGKLSYASSGAGSSPQLAMELFKLMTRIDVVHDRPGDRGRTDESRGLRCVHPGGDPTLGEGGEGRRNYAAIAGGGYGIHVLC